MARLRLSRIAEIIARAAHHGQVEKSTGDPYIRHVERVVDLVDGDEAKSVAWLHDVLEDCQGWTTQRLHEAGICSTRVLAAVEWLTRNKGDTYERYIEKIRLSGNTLARAVKIADLRDHLRPNCPARLRPRYEKALAKLSR